MVRDGMKLTFLGTAGSTISVDRNYPAFLVNDDLLLDCGEGTTQQLLKNKSLTNKIKTICITHLHNDHFLGAFSLLWHYWISQRKEDIEIIGPPKLEKTFETILNLVNTPERMRSFKIHYKELKESDEIQDVKTDYKIKAIKVNHGIEAFAYRIESENKSICYSGDKGA